jgi:hypothetical protein
MVFYQSMRLPYVIQRQLEQYRKYNSRLTLLQVEVGLLDWGSDLSLLVKAANENGYTGKFFTYYAGVTGTPTALGTAAQAVCTRWLTTTTTWAARWTSG